LYQASGGGFTKVFAGLGVTAVSVALLPGDLLVFHQTLVHRAAVIGDRLSASRAFKSLQPGSRDRSTGPIHQQYFSEIHWTDVPWVAGCRCGQQEENEYMDWQLTRCPACRSANARNARYFAEEALPIGWYRERTAWNGEETWAQQYIELHDDMKGPLKT
jgi:hypothetical protein